MISEKVKKNIFIIIFSLCFFIILVSSILNIYEKRNKIKNFVLKKIADQKYYNLDDQKWSKEILKGGYIIYIRHSFRKNGEDPDGDFYNVWTYDAIELFNLENKNIKAENTYLSDATCLTNEGKILAKTIGLYFEILNINHDKIISSPSCRARQHATLSFGKIDKFYNELVHYGPWNEKLSVFENNIKKILLKEAPSNNNNTIIVAHNGVMSRNIFDEFPADSSFYLKQGGFFLIKVEDNKIKLKHTFDEFYKFSNTLLERPNNN